MFQTRRLRAGGNEKVAVSRSRFCLSPRASKYTDNERTQCSGFPPFAAVLPLLHKYDQQYFMQPLKRQQHSYHVLFKTKRVSRGRDFILRSSLNCFSLSHVQFAIRHISVGVSMIHFWWTPILHGYLRLCSWAQDVSHYRMIEKRERERERVQKVSEKEQ